MEVKIQPSKIKGSIAAPTSKSSMQRACAAALIRRGVTIIHNPGKSNDDLAALDVIQKLGAKIIAENDTSISIESNKVIPITNELNCGESGLGIRMFTPIAALSSNNIKITGEGSLLDRPMNFFDEIFPKLSIAIKSRGGKLPLQIKGPIKPVDITIDGSLSSQFLTGLLLAYSSAATHPVVITVTDLKSRPYIDLTLDVMNKFGMNVPVNNEYKSFHFAPPKLQSTSLINYTVEGDWSGAAFLLVAGAIAGNITVTGLDVFSTQADKAILKALMDSGCTISIQEKSIEVGPAPLKAFHFNATDCPDLFPPLVALAAYCDGTTVIEGVFRLKHKESNRAITLQQEFGKLGLEITLQDNLMLIKGGKGLTGSTVYSNHDHRIAMACAVAALRAIGDTIIESAEAINKSYPNFYDDLSSLGVDIHKVSLIE